MKISMNALETGFAKQVPQVLDGRSYFSEVVRCGTQGYMAPELLDGEMSTKVDVYSFGVVGIYIILYAVLILSAFYGSMTAYPCVISIL